MTYPPITAFLEGPVNVKDYGVVGDGSVDDTQAFADIFRTFQYYQTRTDGPRLQGGEILIPAGAYSVSHIDASQCNFLKVTSPLGAAFIYGNRQVGTAKPVFDLNGSSNCHLSGITIAGCNPGQSDPPIRPTVGLLVSAGGAGGNSNGNTFDNILMQGRYQVASVYGCNTVDNTFIACRPDNQDRTKPSWIFTSGNIFGISPVDPGYPLQAGADHCGTNHFVNVGSSSVTLNGVSSFSFHGGMFDATDVGFRMMGRCESVSFHGIKHGCDHVPDNGFIYIDGGDLINLGIYGLYLQSGINASKALIKGSPTSRLLSPTILGTALNQQVGNGQLIGLDDHPVTSTVRIQGGMIDAANSSISPGGSIGAGTMILNRGPIYLPSGAYNHALGG